MPIGDVAELGGALDRVAEVFAHGREIAAMGEHADAVAELQHEIGARQDVGVAAADLDDDGRLLSRQVEIAQGSAHHRRAGGKHAQIVEVPAVLDEVAGRGLAEDRARLRERLLGGSGGEQRRHFRRRQSWARPARCGPPDAGRQSAPRRAMRS